MLVIEYDSCERHRNIPERHSQKKIDISTKFLYEIETGRKGFSADILYRTANELSVSCEYIMTGKDFKYNESLIYILKSLKPKQIAHIREILMLLYNICDTF